MPFILDPSPVDHVVVKGFSGPRISLCFVRGLTLFPEDVPLN